MAYQGKFKLIETVKGNLGNKPVVHASFVLLEDAVDAESHTSIKKGVANPEPQGTILEVKNLSPEEAAKFSKGGNYVIDIKSE